MSNYRFTCNEYVDREFDLAIFEIKIPSEEFLRWAHDGGFRTVYGTGNFSVVSIRAIVDEMNDILKKKGYRFPVKYCYNTHERVWHIRIAITSEILLKVDMACGKSKPVIKELWDWQMATDSAQ